VNILVFKVHNKLQFMLIKNEKKSCKNGKNTAFWQNHGIWRKSRFLWFPCFRDFLPSCSIHQ